MKEKGKWRQWWDSCIYLMDRFEKVDESSG